MHSRGGGLMLSVSYLLYSVLLDCGVFYFVLLLGPACSFFIYLIIYCAQVARSNSYLISLRDSLKTTKVSRLRASPNTQSPYQSLISLSHAKYSPSHGALKRKTQAGARHDQLLEAIYSVAHD